MNVRIVQLNLPFKICISVNLYEIDFKYKDECKQNLPCKISISGTFMKLLLDIRMNVRIVQHNLPCKISISVAFIFTISLLDRYECKYCIVQQNQCNLSDRYRVSYIEMSVFKWF